MKKFFRLIAVAVFAVALVGCAPMSKESYLEKFAKFMDELSTLYTTCPQQEWVELEKKFEKFSAEYYDKFEAELSGKEKLVVLGYEAKFVGYQSYREIKGFVQGAGEVIDGAVDDVKNYIENDLERDIDSLKRDMEQVVDEIDAIVEESI